MSFDFVLLLAVSLYLQKSLRNNEMHVEWYRRLKIATTAAIILLSASVIFSSARPVLEWVGKASLVALVYLLFKEKVFKPARPVFIAILPYIVVSILVLAMKRFVPAFYKDWDSLLNNLSSFSVLWGIGVWFVTRKQRKELVKTKEKMLNQEQQNRLISAMKDELEMKVAERTVELTQQKEELQATLENLQATQTQLIQSEKMASLGELTAGIAHEIQNPLNFVNNFFQR